jgi:hypothetical protein
LNPFTCRDLTPLVATNILSEPPYIIDSSRYESVELDKIAELCIWPNIAPLNFL